MSNSVMIPRSLLLDRNLSATARLLWAFIRLGAPSQPTAGGLAATSGLAPNTVLRGLNQLQAAGWLPAVPAEPPCPAIAVELLMNKHIGAREKLLYATLQLTPGFRRPEGSFTYRTLGALAGVTTDTVKAAVRTLRDAGWLEVSQENQLSPIGFTLRNPENEQRDSALAAMKERLVAAQFRGEALMREYLSLLVDSDEFDDNASPGFLVNPSTGEELQLDRYYTAGVAFEYNGPQHQGPTDRFPSAAKARKQQTRDLIKLGICVTREIRLITCQYGDLTLKAMQQKVTGLLPLRDLTSQEPVIAYLEKVSAIHRKDAAKIAARAAARRATPTPT